MKSHLTSVGKFFHSYRSSLLSLFAVVGLTTLSGCTIKHIREQDNEAELVIKEESGSTGEVSLKGESEARQELRKDIPEPVRVQNDERAIILGLMVEEKDTPELIKMRFDTMMSRMRNEDRRTNDKKREEFKRAEKSKRDEFLKAQKTVRADFTASLKKKKLSREETTQFYNDQEAKRKDFFADEREKRQAFESEMRQITNDNSSRFRSWQSEFNQEHRLYQQKWRAKAEAKKKEREEALRLLNKPPSQ